MSREFEIQKLVLGWARARGVIFFSDPSGFKLPIGYAKKLKALRNPQRGLPDTFIPAARNGYHGLFIEFKASKDEIIRKDGKYRDNRHLQEQLEVHRNLRELGYCVEFVYEVNQGIELIRSYLESK